MDWILDRVKEPSTWAGVAIGCIIVGIMTGIVWVTLGGCVGGAGALFLKEKGVT